MRTLLKCARLASVRTETQTPLTWNNTTPAPVRVGSLHAKTSKCLTELD